MNKVRILVLYLLVIIGILCGCIFGYNAYKYSKYILLDGELIDKTDVTSYEKILKERNKIFDNNFDDCISYDIAIKDNSIFDYSIIFYEQKIDYEKLKTDIELYNSKARQSSDAYISTEFGHYIVVPEVNGAVLDTDRILKDVSPNKHINIFNYEIKPAVNSAQLQPIVDTLNKFVDWSVTYNNGFKVEASIEYVKLENDIPILDDSFIDSYVDQLESMFDTVGSTKPFTTVDGVPIEVSGGTWGDTMDTDAEISELKRLFNIGESQVEREPIYLMQMGDIGTSYVEISLERQHMWYIQDGVSIFDTPVVTGNVSTGRATKPGFYYMLEHTRNHWMRGDDYLVLATWWMRLTWSGVGIHDAPSRSAFGGDIYQYNGSHGCINTPPSKVAELFELTDVMTPVIIY